MKRRIALLMAVLGVALGATQTRAADTPAPGLPLRDVALFSSGVGYFGRAARINGAATVDMSFRAEQINDVLKSLVLFDAAGGVRPVTYTTQESILRRLRAAGLTLDRNITLGGLLRQFQGARVRLETRRGAVEGLIISVSTKSAPVPGKGSTLMPVEVVTVMTAKGLQAVNLEEVTRVRLLDEKLDRELRESLALLATNQDEQRRAVSLHFGGGAAREVRAGYLLETPVWKTTYRLVVGDAKDKTQKPYLQGWAIVENMTDEDWKDVHLSLISGRPVSFIQDLYQPLYVPRPVVAPQVIGSPLPQTYGEALEETKRAMPVLPARKPSNQPVDSMRSLRESGATGPQGPAGVAGDRDEAVNGALGLRYDMSVSAQNMAQSVAAQAAGGERGELFEYSISQPVTLPKQQAALVPIVSEIIEGEKLSIFDANSTVDYALNGFRLKNSTGLHLQGGPLTIFDGGIYAGDAQINNVGPGEDRLISYAVDLALVVKREQPVFRRETISIVARSGVLTITHKQFRDLIYTFHNKSDEPKTVYVQQSIEPDFTLLEPVKPEEKTVNQYRFKVEVPAGQTVTFKVVTVRPVSETIALLNVDFNMLVEYARNAQLSPKLKEALQGMVARRRKITELQAQVTQLDLKIQEIDQDQTRIRNNMQGLNQNSDLYKRYVTKLNAQETELEKLRESRALARDAEAEAQKQLRAFIDTLTTE